MKTNDDYFADWESHVFGYGYGTGEEYILPGLKLFMDYVPDDGSYHHDALEAALGPAAAWLFINILCHADVIEYGTSPRYAWLTPQGKALKAYLASKSAEELGAILSDYDSYCYPDHCNCDGERCHNPFWIERPSQFTEEK